MLARRRSLALLKWLPSPCFIDDFLHWALASLCVLEKEIRDGKKHTPSQMRHVVSDVVHPNRLILDNL